MDEFAELKAAIAEPTQEPEEDFSVLKNYLDTEDAYASYPVLNLALQGESTEDKDVRNISRGLQEENRRAQEYLKEIEGPGETADNWEKAGGFLRGTAKTIGRTFSSASTLPSRAIEEESAKLSKEGEPTVDIERAIGSTVNLVKSLAPGGQSPSEALKDFSVTDTEGARAKLKRILSKPIIDENGNVNKERLDYSDLNRWMQNELSTVWAAQRTGVNNREFWRAIIQSRAGVLADDNPAEAGVKRAGQAADAMLFNVPTYLLGKAILGGNESLYQKYGNTPSPTALSRGQLETMQSGTPQIFTDKGQYYTRALNGDVVPLENFDPALPQQEQERIAKLAIFNDTKMQLEFQAQEAAMQVLDPSLLIGAGVVKKGTQAGLRAVGAAKLASKVGKLSTEAGLIERTAGALSKPSTSFLGVGSRLAKDTVDLMHSNSTKGAILRNSDKVLSGMAYASGLGALGAPEGTKVDAGIASGLMALGMAPIAMLNSPRKDTSIFNTNNKNAIREVLNNKDITGLSNYTRKLVEQDMKKKKMGNDYGRYRAYAMSPKAMQDLADHYTDWLSQENTTPSMIVTAAQDLASNKHFQKVANDATTMIDNQGISWYGHHVQSAMMKVLKESREHAQTAGDTKGSASVVPQSVSSRFAIKDLAAIIRNLSADLINNPEAFNAWIDNEIAGGPLMPNTPPSRLSKDIAMAVKAQVNAYDLNRIYQPLAHIAFVSNVAMREASSNAKALNSANMVNNYTDLIEHFRNLPDQDKMQLLRDLEATESGTPSEGILHKLNRRMDKPEQWNVSPAASSKVLADDYLSNAKQKSLLATQISEQRMSEAAATDPQTKASHKKLGDELQAKYDAMENSSFTYQMYKFATDKVKEYVGNQQKIRNDKLTKLKADAAAEKDLNAKMRKSSMRRDWVQQKILIEKSRIDAIRDSDVLRQKAIGLQDKKMLQETVAANKRQIAKDALMKTHRAMDADDILDGKTRANFTKVERARDPAVKAVADYKRVMSDIKTTERQINLTEAHKITIDKRADDINNTIDKMDTDVVSPNTHRQEALDWFDEEVAMAGNLKIDGSNLYQNIRREILDVMTKRVADKESGLQVMQPIPKNLIAALRVMGDEDVLRDVLKVDTTKNKANIKVFTRSINAFADKLEKASDRSKIANNALDDIKLAMETPSKTSIAQLLRAQRNLNDTLFLPELMKDMANPNGVYAKVEKLVSNKSKTYLTRDDWRTLQILVADSPMGKGYRKYKEMAGLVEPWMITYSQDVANMMDQFFALSGDVVSKSIEETRRFLVETNQIKDPTEFDVVSAAAFLMSLGDKPGTVRPGMMDLIGLANAWRDATSRGASEWNTTENIAVSVSRQMGMDIEADMRTMFGGATTAATQAEYQGRRIIDDLLKIESGDTRYSDHLRPDSPVRRMLNFGLVGTDGRSAIGTPFVDFAMSGYNKGMRIFQKSDVKAAISPEDINELRTTVYLTDHIIVDGEYTAFGEAYKEWNMSYATDENDFINAYMDKKIPTHLQRLAQKEFDDLKVWMIDKLKMYGKFANVDDFKIYVQAMKTIQKHDKEGLIHLNYLNDLQNKRDNTSYPSIEYNPWRLDTQVPTRSDDVTNDSALFGSFADADRVMGNRYSTSPENQVAKAAASGIVEKELYLSPEQMYLNRYARLYNEMLTRKARASLARKAILMEHMGYKEVASDVKRYVIEAGQIDVKGRNWATKLGDSIIESSNQAAMFAGVLLRQVFNPFIVLTNPISTIIEQPLQTALTQISTLPTFRGILNGASSVKQYWAAYPHKWVSGVVESIFKNTAKLNVISNGKNIKIDGQYAGTLERLWQAHTKRVDPFVQAIMAESKRGGEGKLKQLSLFSATAAGSPEAIAMRMMFTLKERAENTQTRALMPQIGAIWQTSMDVYKSQGTAAMYNHLSQFMEGPFSNPALQRDVVRLVEQGKDVEALRVFGSHYLAQNVGTWNHTNVPKAIRNIAHHVTGSDQFFTAQTLGIYRIVGAISSITSLTPEQRARTIASAVAIMAMAGGLGALSANSEIDWFQRLSPISAVTKLWTQVSSKDKAFSLATNIGTRAEIKSGMSQAMAMRATYSALGLIKTYVASDKMTEKDEITKFKERKRLQQQLISLLLDMSFARPIISAGTLPVGGLTPAEATKGAQDILTPLVGSGLPGNQADSDLFDLGLLGNVFDERDAFILRETLKHSHLEADKLASKLERIEAGESGPINGSLEGMALFAIEQFAKLSMTAQEASWEAFAPYEFRQTPFDKDPGYTEDQKLRRKILSRGLAGSDVRSEQYVRMIESWIKRYEAQKTQNLDVISGKKAPRSNEQPNDPGLRQ